MKTILLRAVAAVLLHQSVFAAECGMSLAFRQPDERGTVARAVWQDAAGSALLFGDALKVNTDGTRRSYSVDDFWGERIAINNVCNAMSDACAGLGKAQLKARRVLAQQAKAQGWPADLLRQTRIDAGIIPFRDGRPCEDGDFLVSATALQDARVADRCDASRYLDALAVASVVLPRRMRRGTPTGFEQRNARIGDLVAVVTADGDRPVFAVVGDSGPARELGEGSVALAGALLGKSAPPRNYQEVKKEWGVPAAFVLVFPGTRDAAEPFITQDRIARAGEEAFGRWGGMARLAACRLAYRSR